MFCSKLTSYFILHIIMGLTTDRLEISHPILSEFRRIKFYSPWNHKKTYGFWWFQGKQRLTNSAYIRLLLEVKFGDDRSKVNGSTEQYSIFPLLVMYCYSFILSVVESIYNTSYLLPDLARSMYYVRDLTFFRSTVQISTIWFPAYFPPF